MDLPREKYIVDYHLASEDDLYEALAAPPVVELEAAYSLDEIRYSYALRERMRRVDLDEINFEFGSWEISSDQYPKLERLARVIKRIIDRRQDEVFLIEGHTDAVGSDIDNLTLSDRRAEAVAVALSEAFAVPAENLVTQGYGEQFLKIETADPSRANRRVSVRRITPLLDREGADGPVSQRDGDRLFLTAEDKAFILDQVDRRAESRLGLGALAEGDPIPRGVRLWAFPPRVVQRIPELRQYRYFLFEDQVAVVNSNRSEVLLMVGPQP
jgi:outer membrane protein OmpA-like peptidoglycan-associated protein